MTAEAREHGDLKENAEYHAVRDQQSFCQGRIQDIEAKLLNVKIIDVTKIPHNDKVIFGPIIDIINIGTDEKITYQVVEDDESDV